MEISGTTDENKPKCSLVILDAKQLFNEMYIICIYYSVPLYGWTVAVAESADDHEDVSN